MVQVETLVGAVKRNELGLRCLLTPTSAALEILLLKSAPAAQTLK